jgi:hypothetical protein
LQGTFEKIHFHRFLGEHSLQMVDLLTVGRRVRTRPRGTCGTYYPTIR